jgi:hypothetical protein
MPTLDYYGFEHEDAITGFVAEYDAQIFNRWVHAHTLRAQTSQASQHRCLMRGMCQSVVWCVAGTRVSQQNTKAV